MFHHIQNWHDNNINEPIPANLSEWDRRCHVIQKVAEKVNQSYGSLGDNRPTPIFKISPQEQLTQAGISQTVPDSIDQRVTWEIQLGFEWFLTKDELLSGGVSPTIIRSNIDNWVEDNCPNKIAVTFSKQARLLSAELALGDEHQSLTYIWGTLGHEFGHAVHDHQGKYDQVFRTRMLISLIPSSTIFLAVSFGALNAGLTSNLDFGIVMGVATLSKLATLRVMIRLTEAHQMRRHEWEADLYSTRSPLAVEGSAKEFRLRYELEVKALGLKWYFHEARKRLLNHHPTVYQRMLFFEKIQEQQQIAAKSA